jgi:uncharacterized repeat protein (TIGR03803 family)
VAPYGKGTVFELAPKLGGGWTEKVLHVFGNGSDGQLPSGSLVLDSAGNLYGTTTSGGAHLAGTVFELSPRANGAWIEKILHNFNNNGPDGYDTFLSGVILDSSGNLYGTTAFGGTHGLGTVFELSPQSGGGWTERILHNFNNDGADGTEPISGLTLDSAGNLYGTTSAAAGGTPNGTVFELKRKPGGAGRRECCTASILTTPTRTIPSEV